MFNVGYGCWKLDVVYSSMLMFVVLWLVVVNVLCVVVMLILVCSDSVLFGCGVRCGCMCVGFSMLVLLIM